MIPSILCTTSIHWLLLCCLFHWMRGWAFPNPTSVHPISLHLSVFVKAVTTNPILDPTICLSLQILIQFLYTSLVCEGLASYFELPKRKQYPLYTTHWERYAFSARNSTIHPRLQRPVGRVSEHCLSGLFRSPAFIYWPSESRSYNQVWEECEVRPRSKASLGCILASRCYLNQRGSACCRLLSWRCIQAGR